MRLTHPDRLYWPDQGVTKQGLADYYTDVWRYIAPFIVNRPLALLRCPNGVEGEKFFQKHAWKGIDPNIVLVNDPKGEEEPLLSIKDLDGLIALVQSGALEIHPWGSTRRIGNVRTSSSWISIPAKRSPWEVRHCGRGRDARPSSRPWASPPS